MSDVKLTKKELEAVGRAGKVSGFILAALTRMFAVPWLVMLLLGAATPWPLGYWIVVGGMWLIRLVSITIGYSATAGGIGARNASLVLKEVK